MISRKLRFVSITILMALLTVVASCSGDNTTTAPEGEAVLTPTPREENPSALATISLEQALSSGRPTLAEFGSNQCAPCKLMKPILEELAVEYQDKLNVVIIDVYKHRDLAGQFEIMTIPTQIFFDSSGNGVIKHTGILPKEAIIAVLNEMGIE